MPSDPKVPPAKLVRIVERLRHHLYRLHQRLVPPASAMIEQISAAHTAQAIRTAAVLNIADALAEGPRRLDELSECVGSPGTSPLANAVWTAAKAVALLKEGG